MNYREDQGDALGLVKEYLEREGLRVTDTRLKIASTALETTGHFDSEDILRGIRAKGESAALSSIYRMMPILVEAGILEQTEVSQDKRLYEVCYGKEHHDHLICSNCGTVEEFQYEALAVLEKEVARKFGFTLTKHFHELVGLCPSCQKPGSHQ